MSQNLANKKIKELYDRLEMNKNFTDTRSNKLLIISCSDKKKPSGIAFYIRNYFNSDSYNYLNVARVLRKYHYREFIDANPENILVSRGFEGNGNITQANDDYFIDCINGNEYMQAFERYDGFFYSDELKRLYLEKNRDCNLHILIVSGLYGILEFRDEIIDYHFKIIDGARIWGNCLTETINQYISENNIENEFVYYSLSNSYLDFITPRVEWKNIWIKHDRGQTAARFLKDYFLPNL